MLFLSCVFLASLSFPSHTMVDSKAVERKKANEYVHKMFEAVNNSDTAELLHNYSLFKNCHYTSVPGIPDFWSLSALLVRAAQISTDEFLEEFMGDLPCDLTTTVYDADGNEKTLADYALFYRKMAMTSRFNRYFWFQRKINDAKKLEAMNESLREYLNLIDGNTTCCITNQAFYNNLKHQIACLLDKGETYPLDEAKSCVREAARCGMGQLKACAIIELGMLPLKETVFVNDFLESYFSIALHNSIDSVAKAFISAGIDVNQHASASSASVKHKLKLLGGECYVLLNSDGKFSKVPECVYEKLQMTLFAYICSEHASIITKNPAEQRLYLVHIVEGFKVDPGLKDLYSDVIRLLSSENLNTKFAKFCEEWKKSYAYRQTTPLMIAVKEKNLTMTRALLEAGARIETEDRAGNGVFDHNTHDFLIESCLLDFYVVYLQKLTSIVREVLAASSLEQSADPLIHDIILPYIYPQDPYVRHYYENHLRSLKKKSSKR